MLHKPTQHTLFRNTGFALNGLLEVTRNERSFKLQIILFVTGMIVAWVLPVSFIHSAILSVSLFIPLIAELTNSAIERTVDLVTFEHHELAKRAKDAGAAVVFLSLCMTSFVWLLTLCNVWTSI